MFRAFLDYAKFTDDVISADDMLDLIRDYMSKAISQCDSNGVIKNEIIKDPSRMDIYEKLCKWEKKGKIAKDGDNYIIVEW